MQLSNLFVLSQNCAWDTGVRLREMLLIDGKSPAPATDRADVTGIGTLVLAPGIDAWLREKRRSGRGSPSCD